MKPEFVPCSGESWRDPYRMYATLRDHDPVHHHDLDDYWVLSRHAEVFAAARDTATFSSRQGLTTTYRELEAIGMADTPPMVMLDPPEHTDFRRRVGRGFTPRQVNDIEPTVRQFVVDRLEQLRTDGGGDIVEALFKPLPSMVVASYLGVPREDWTRFDGWTNAIVAANSLGDVFSASSAVAELFDYFSALAERRRHQPGDDAISHLVQSGKADRTDPKVATTSLVSILGFAFTMVTGGNDTTTGMLGGSSLLLASHPEQRQQLVNQPDAIPAAVEELLRLTSPVQGLARTTTHEVAYNIDGQRTTIPAHRKVLLLYGSANVDPRQFGHDAAELRIDRNPSHILTFSYGAHHCLGAAAARLQARVTIEELLRRCPTFQVDPTSVQYADGNYVRRPTTLSFTPES